MYFECQLKQLNLCERTKEVDIEDLKRNNQNIDINNFSGIAYKGWILSKNYGDTFGWSEIHRSYVESKIK